MMWLSMLLTILTLLGAIGLFLYGMKLMSEALQKVAGQRLRSTISAVTTNPFKGLASGLVITAAIQSSSASTVMITGLVNAGLLTLRQSFPLILGANIGTTLKAWFFSTLGFRLDLNLVLLPMAAVSLFFLFSQNYRKKSFGELLMGFALLFLGLELLKDYLPVLNADSDFILFLKGFQQGGIGTVLLFVLAGAVFTAIIQSSSAGVALTLAMLNSGWFSYEYAVAMVLGENIGTTITANLAALVANTQAKRAALAHFLFNFSGVLFVLLWFYPFIELTQWLTTLITNDQTLQPDTMLIGLALVHTFFNVMMTLIWMNMITSMMKVTTLILPDRGDKYQRKNRLIQNHYLLRTSEFSLLQAKKEIHNLSRVNRQLFKLIPELLVEKDADGYSLLTGKVQMYKNEIESSWKEVSHYLSQLNENELSLEGRTRKKVMLFISEQMRNIMNTSLKMTLIVEEKNERKIWFTPKQRLNLNRMFDLVNELMRVMSDNLEGDYHLAQFDYAHEIEENINQLRDKLRQKNIENIEKGKYSVEGGNTYNELFSMSERTGDYITLINDSLTSCRLQPANGAIQ